MTTYSICSSNGKDLGKFEAESATGARDAWARSLGYASHNDMPSCEGDGNLVVTAVGLPEAPALAACPFKLPLSVGNSSGGVPDQIYDTTDQAVLILYSVDSRGTVDEARTMSWNQEGLRRGDYVVKAVNEHEGLVKRVAELEDLLGRAMNNAFVNKMAHVMDTTLCEHLIAKPAARIAEMQLTLDAVQAALGDIFDGEVGHARSVLRLKTAFDAEAKLGETYKKLAISGELPEITYLTAKPVDRRKD